MDYIYCRSCGGKNPEDATFCNRCGKRLDYSIDVVDLTNVEITESTTTSTIPPPSESTEPDAKWWNNKGNEYYFKDDYESALDCYSKAIKLDPNLWAGWYNSSLALSKLGREDEARKAKKKADELGKPKPSPTRDDDKKSVQDIVQTSEDKPLDGDQKRKGATEASVWKNRGDNSVDREQYEEAIQYYRKALELDPDYANAWNNLGFAYYKVGQPEKAQECKETAARKIEEKKRITQSTSISKQPSEKVHLEDNIGKETCLNCGAILPYSRGHWPVGKPKLCPKCGIRVKDPIRYGSGSGQGKTHEEQRKNPTVTGLLSIFPGVGQLDNGQLGKGLLLLIGWSIGLFLYFIPSLIIWIYGIYDAHKTAKMMNYGDIPFKKMKGTNIAVYFVTMIVILLIVGGIGSTLLSGPSLPTSNTNTLSVAQIKASAKIVPYDSLFRYNEGYVGDVVYFKGEIVQVENYFGDDYHFRIATKNGYDDIIYVNYVGSRLLEGDTVEIWGTVKGLKRYTSIFGQSVTIPEIDSLHLQQVIG